MKKVWLGVGSVFVALFFVVAVCGGSDKGVGVSKIQKEEYKESAITLKIDWEIEKDFVFQVFYTDESNKVFNAKYSLRKQVTPTDKHIEIELPAKKIYKIRFDFGSNPEKVVLKKVEITGDQYINFSNWNEYSYTNIEKHKINKEDNSLELYSSHRDPYMSFIYPFVLFKKTGINNQIL